MKKSMATICLAALLTLVAGVAGAESIEGKFGITGRIGFLVPSEMDLAITNPALSRITGGAGLASIGTDVGLNGGGGFIYGITNSWAAEIEVTHSSFGTDGALTGIGDARITDIALGVQYRFLERQRLVPYVGAGGSILINDLDSTNGISWDVDTVPGVYVKGGVDYFIIPAVALNAEGKATVAPPADISVNGVRVGNFAATNFAGSVGVRLFFP